MDTGSRNRYRNPQLEDLRDSVLNNQQQQDGLLEIAKKLMEDFSDVHAGFLFIEENGIKARKSICALLTSTSNNVINNGWEDFGAELGLPTLELKCIHEGNYKILPHCPDYTENTLLVFAQNKDATIGKILRALLNIKRFDVISRIINDLEGLSQNIKNRLLEIERSENSNSEYSARNTDINLKKIDGIITAEGLAEYISQLLPITLSNNQVKPEVFRYEITYPKRRVQIESIQQREPSLPQDTKKYQYSKLVLLTFAADGEILARKIAQTLRNTIYNDLPVGVLILQDHMNNVLTNAEEFIRHLFPQMDFIIPVLTEGYFEALKNGNLTSDCLDERYVKFIYVLMGQYYVRNQCQNKKIRCILPDSSSTFISKNKKFQNDPMLQAWVKENDIQDLACIITKYG